MRSKVEEDVEVLHQRQAIVSSKSPAELSQIHSFAEVPIPRAVESWLHQGGEEGSKSVISLTTNFLHTYVEKFRRAVSRIIFKKWKFLLTYLSVRCFNETSKLDWSVNILTFFNFTVQSLMADGIPD